MEVNNNRARQLFDKHIVRIRELAEHQERSFVELMKILSGTEPTLKYLLLDPQKLEEVLIESYRPLYYETLVNDFSEQLEENFDLLSLDRKMVGDAFHALSQKKANLAMGPAKAAEARKKKSDENKRLLHKAIDDLFSRDDCNGYVMNNNQIVSFLKRANCDFGYADSSILSSVKKRAAQHRAERKNRMAR